MSDPELGITHAIGVPLQYNMMAALPEFETVMPPALSTKTNLTTAWTRFACFWMGWMILPWPASITL